MKIYKEIGLENAFLRFLRDPYARRIPIPILGIAFDSELLFTHYWNSGRLEVVSS